MKRRADETADLASITVVRSLAPLDRLRFVHDSGGGRRAAVVGLFVVVNPGGAKRWGVRFFFRGIRRRVVLGPTDQLAPAEAIAEAQRLLATVAKANADPTADIIDPAVVRGQARQSHVRAHRAHRHRVTVQQVGERWLTSLRTTAGPRWTRLAEHALRSFPAPLATLPVAELTIGEVRELMEARRDTPAMANVLRVSLAAIIDRAAEDGDRDPSLPNPAKLVKAYKLKSRTRILSDSDPPTDPLREWRDFGRAWLALRADLITLGAAQQVRGLDAVLLILLTGARHDAIRLRRWSDVDLERGIMRVDPPHKRVTEIHLGEAARALLGIMHATHGYAPSDYLVHRDDTDGPVWALRRDPWRALLLRAGITDRLTIHDLRRSFASTASDLGLPRHVEAALCGHKLRGISEVYLRARRPQIRAGADQVSLEIARRLELVEWLGLPATVAPAVVPFIAEAG